MDGSNLSPRWISSRFIVGSDDCETNVCAARFAATEDGATEVNSWKSSRREISSDPWMIRRFGSVFEKCNYIFALRRDVLSFLFFVPFRSFSFLLLSSSGNGKRRDLRAAAHRDGFRGNRGNVKFREGFARFGRSRRPRNDPTDRDKR